MPTTGGTVLVVDDSASKRYVLVSWLRRAGYQVREAETGGDALARLADGPADAVVLDVRLPDMSGFEVAEAIKSDPRFAAVPVVHVSAHAVNTVDRTEGLTRGADAYLVEPIEPEELVATVHAMMRYYRARRHAELLATRLSRLADATLGIQVADNFDSLVGSTVTGAATIFDGPASCGAVRPDGTVVAASIPGPGRSVRVLEYNGGFAGGTSPDTAPLGVNIYTEPFDRWKPSWPEEYAGRDIWIAVARPRGNRPAAYVAIPAGSAEDEDDHVLTQLAQTVALAAEAMRSFDEERRIALTLQRSLLPRVLPTIKGYDLAVRYAPASSYAEIGGDFYEVAVVDDRVYVAIGDVVGHSLHAATVMAELRHALRAYVADGHSPSVVLDRLNSLMLRFLPGEMATLLLLAIDPANGAMRVANAGHMPALLVSDNSADYLPVGGPLLGVSLPRPTDVHLRLQPGCTLVLYTDGLVERRGEIIDEGLARLAASAVPVDADLEAFSDRVIDHHHNPAHDDDVALVILRRT